MNENANACKHCGQILVDDALCSCSPATREQKIQKQVDEANRQIDEIFENNEDIQIRESKAAKAILLLKEAVKAVATGVVYKASFQISGVLKANITLTSKDKIKVIFTQTKLYQFEE